MHDDWQPANDVEREMGLALEAGDHQHYARAVMSAPLLIPQLPERESVEWRELAERLPQIRDHVLAFTSDRAMAGALGEGCPHRMIEFAELRRRWPDPVHGLALNPGLPIGAMLPVTGLDAIAGGTDSLISLDDVQDVVRGELFDRIRQLCLSAWGHGTGLAADIDEPSNECERALWNAADDEDVDGFVETLLAADMVFPTTAPAQLPEGIPGPDFPWRVFGAGLPIVPAFSSEPIQELIASPEQHWITMPLLGALIGWPSSEHALCLNPGSRIELILLPRDLADMLESVTESM